FVAGMDDSWAGLSLTMPLKYAALSLADHVDPQAEAVGAVNTLLRGPGGLLTAANTDVYGLTAALGEVTTPGHTAQHAVIVGAGATACSALAALGELGIHRPVVLARSLQRVGAVHRAASKMGTEPQFRQWDGPEVPRLLRSADIVLSTVPQYAADGLAAHLHGTRLQEHQVLLDVVYADWPTAVASAWQEAGGTIAPGHLMLLHQGVEQVRLMTGGPDRWSRCAVPCSTPSPGMKDRLRPQPACRADPPGRCCCHTGAMSAAVVALVCALCAGVVAWRLGRVLQQLTGRPAW